MKAKRADGRENHIPHSRVVKITENAVKKATAALAEEHTRTLTEKTAKLTEYEAHLTRIAEVENLMFNDPDAFIEVLNTLPGYAERFGAKTAPAAQFVPTEARPRPDAQNADGSPGYSEEGLQALLDWTISQASAKATAEAEARISKRYEPIERSFKQKQADAEFDRVEAPKVAAKLKDARDNWEGYREHEAEIQAAYLADKSLTLDAAWRKVVVPKLKASQATLKTDRAAIRAEILAELAKAPAGTSIGSSSVSTAAKVTADAEPATPEDAVRAALRAKKLI